MTAERLQPETGAESEESKLGEHAQAVVKEIRKRQDKRVSSFTADDSFPRLCGGILPQADHDVRLSAYARIQHPAKYRSHSGL